MGAENEGIDVNVPQDENLKVNQHHENRAVVYSVDANGPALRDLMPIDSMDTEQRRTRWPKNTDGTHGEAGFEGKFESTNAWTQLRNTKMNPVTRESQRKPITEDPIHQIKKGEEVQKACTIEMEAEDVVFEDQNKKHPNRERQKVPGIYMGDTLNGKRHGFGVFRTPYFVQVGNWENNVFQGMGAVTEASGNYKSGYFEENKLKKGTQIKVDTKDLIIEDDKKRRYKKTVPTIAWYEGDFKSGIRDGIGEAKTKNIFYRGDFKNDKLNGKGRIKFLRSKSEYEGTFKDGQISGEGRFTWKDGVYYEGTFENGQLQGENKMSKVNIGARKKKLKEKELPAINFGPTHEEALYLKGKDEAQEIDEKKRFEIYKNSGVSLEKGKSDYDNRKKLFEEEQRLKREKLNELIYNEKEYDDFLRAHGINVVDNTKDEERDKKREEQNKKKMIEKKNENINNANAQEQGGQ